MLATERELEDRIRAIGQELLGELRESRRSVLAREHWEEALLRRLMESEEFKVQALRFVDVLPTLADDGELVRHLNEYFVDEELPLPGVARWGLRQASRGGLAEHAAAVAVRKAITALAHRFIGGATVKEAAKSARRLWDDGMGFTLDVLGEATVSEVEARHYQQTYLTLLDELAPAVARWPGRHLLDGSRQSAVGSRQSAVGPQTPTHPHTHPPAPRVPATHPHTLRPLPRLNLSVKISSLYSQLNPVDPEESVAAVKERLRPILMCARQRGAAITFDMEQYEAKEITLRAFRDLLAEPGLRDWPDAGIALQAYLRETEADVLALIRWARERGTPVSVRLVRGAYWDYETIVARQNDWPIPVFTDKGGTDLSYERCARHLLEHYPTVETAIATHNVRSIALAVAHARRLGLAAGQYEIQMLYGMADPLKEAVVKQGERLRIYLAFGELIPGMAYLVRRLLENTASQSFLRMGFAEDASPEALLAQPAEAGGNGADGRQDRVDVRTCGRVEEEATRDGEDPPDLTATAISLTPSPPHVHTSTPPHPHTSTPPHTHTSPLPPFRNEPVRRFTDSGERQRFAAAIETVRGQLAREYPLVIGGERRTTGAWEVSTNPARPAEVVGRVAAASAPDAEAAVAAALAAFPGWRRLGARGRAGYLLGAAGQLRARRDELAAWQVFEVGKNWREADADVVEAIDFLEYYAREAVRLEGGPRLHSPPGESNSMRYEPRGVAAVIPPWNFPLAILTGMTAANLAVGNTVVLKPASQSPVIAAGLMEALANAGLPPGVANFLPVPGSDVGEALVVHPQVQVIAFTGSREVGCRILRRAAEVPPEQHHLKRVIAELGGKNAIIVDSDADVDDAVLGTVASAFGYQGQKCSACSRVIVLERLYDAFLRRLIEATRSLRIGEPDDPANLIGPVIDARARERIQATIAAGGTRARLELSVDVSLLGEGHYVGPTIFSGVDPDEPLAQEEIFGPVLCVLRARDLDQALAIANGTRYALTGGIYSRSPANLDRVRQEFEVGNLYINRKITGAIVGRQPFGGFKLSGIGSKAGGPDYLLQMVEPRVTTENTLRRGFAPEPEDAAGEQSGGL